MLPKSAASPQAFAKVPFKVSFSSYPGRDHGALRPRSFPIFTRSSRGATPSRCAGRSRCSSRRWIRCSTRARRRTCCIARREDRSRDGAARYPRKTIATGSSRASPVAQRRSRRRCRRASCAGTLGAAAPRRATVAAAPHRAAPIERTTATSSSSCIRRRCSATGAARTSRGCRSFPIRSRRSAGARGSRSIPTPRRGSASIDGDIVDVKTASGSVTAPAYLYLGIRPDTVAHRDRARGTRAYGRYAQGIGVNALDLLRAVGTTRRRLASCLDEGARVTKAGDHSPLVTHRRLGAAARPRHRAGDRRVAELERESTRRARRARRDSRAMPAHEFLPGLRSPVANDAQGELGEPDSRRTRGCTTRTTGAGWRSAAGR